MEGYIFFLILQINIIMKIKVLPTFTLNLMSKEIYLPSPLFRQKYSHFRLSFGKYFYAKLYSCKRANTSRYEL